MICNGRRYGSPALSHTWRPEPSLGSGRYTSSLERSLCLCQLCFVGDPSVGGSCLSWVSSVVGCRSGLGVGALASRHGRYSC